MWRSRRWWKQEVPGTSMNSSSHLAIVTVSKLMDSMVKTPQKKLDTQSTNLLTVLSRRFKRDIVMNF